MKCCACDKEIILEYKAILLSCDGDFVCDENCKKKWYKDMNRFYAEIAPDPKKFEQWMLGEIE